MKKTFILGVKNTTTQTVPVDGLVNLGSIYRRYDDKDCSGFRAYAINGDSISLQQKGMYKVSVSATFNAAAAGDITLQLLENGTAIPGALATETITTATTEIRSISFDYFIVVDRTCVLGNLSTLVKSLSIQNTGTASANITSLIVNIVKLF